MFKWSLHFNTDCDFCHWNIFSQKPNALAVGVPNDGTVYVDYHGLCEHFVSFLFYCVRLTMACITTQDHLLVSVVACQVFIITHILCQPLGISFAARFFVDLIRKREATLTFVRHVFVPCKASKLQVLSKSYLIPKWNRLKYTSSINNVASSHRCSCHSRVIKTFLWYVVMFYRSLNNNLMDKSTLNANFEHPYPAGHWNVIIHRHRCVIFTSSFSAKHNEHHTLYVPSLCGAEVFASENGLKWEKTQFKFSWW